MKKNLALALMLCVFLGACTAALAQEQVTLRFSWWGGDERLAATLKVIEMFEEQNPSIKIEAEYGSSDGYSDKLATQLAGGTAPDIMQIDPGFFPSLVSDETNYFIDYNAFGFDFSNFDPAYIERRINGNFDGKQLGIPTGLSGGNMLVNKELAESFGFDFGEQYTWDDLFDWAKVVRDSDPEIYLLCSNKEYIANIIANNYIKQLTGKSFMDEETKTVAVTVDELTEMYAFVKRLYDEGVVNPASYAAAYSGDNMQSDPNWIAGKYVACINYTSTCETLAAANPDAEFYAGKFPLMAGSDIDAWNANTPQVIAVNSKSANIEAAVQFVDFFFNDDAALEALGTTRSVPPTAKARKICEETDQISALLAQAGNICESYSGMVDDKYFSAAEAKQIVIDQVEAIGYGVVTPEEAAEETMSLFESYLSTK